MVLGNFLHSQRFHTIVSGRVKDITICVFLDNHLTAHFAKAHHVISPLGLSCLSFIWL